MFPIWAMGSLPFIPPIPSSPLQLLVLSLIVWSPSENQFEIITTMRSTWGTESLQMTTTKTKGRGKLPTLLLKTLIGWVCPARSSSPGVFAYWTSLLLLKQKDNADPCKICGPLTAISRTFGDTIQRHPKGHASDSEYVVLRFDTFLVTKKLACPWEGCDITT